MLEQISELVKQYGKAAVVDNPEIPDQQNNEVMAEATKTITSGMQNMLAGGGLQDIISMFTGSNKPGNNKSNGLAGLLKNPMVTMMIGHLISKLTGKFNMSPSRASQVSNNLIPNVLRDLVGRTVSNDPSNDAFDMNDLIGTLTGGKTATSETASTGFNFQDLLSRLTGSGGSIGDSLNLQDIINQVTKGAQESRATESQGAGEGIENLVKGFFK